MTDGWVLAVFQDRAGKPFALVRSGPGKGNCFFVSFKLTAMHRLERGQKLKFLAVPKPSGRSVITKLELVA